MREIVSGAELGRMFNLSERSIREHRAKGHVFRLGHGYDLKRSVRGFFDHKIVELAKQGRGEMGPLWQEYEEVLRYRAALSDDRDRLREGIEAILGIPGLPPEAQTALLDLLARPGAEEE